MNFLSVLYAKAGITVDGVTTLNNTATALTPTTSDNSTNIATTAFVKNQNYYPYPTGTTSQYVRGDGSLATFTQTGGGGSSVSYYLNGSVSQGTIGGNTYYEMSKTAVVGTGVDFSINANGYVAQFVTDAGDPALLNIPGGNWNFEMYFSASSGGGSPSFYVELYKYDGTTLTLIASGSAIPESITGGTSIDLYVTALAVPTTTLTLTDRLAVRVYVTHSGRTITLHTQDSHLCQIITTFTTGLTALNGLTAQVQNFAVGTSGSDFNISSVTDTHTFNLPTASATKRGALSSIDWSAFDAKVDFGDLSATSPLSYNGSGVFSIAQSSTSTNGYLSSTDWTTFNNKIGGSGTANYIAKFTSGSVVGNSVIYDNGTNVGIGTVNPNSNGGASATVVHIHGVNSGDWAVTHYTNNNTGAAAADGTVVGVIGSGGDMYIFNYENSSIILGTNSNERMRITDGGNVLIGTTSGSFPLTVVGKIGANIFSDSYLEFSSSGHAILKANNDVFVGYSQNFVVKQGGNVGIGTTSPSAKLDVDSTGYSIFANNSSGNRIVKLGTHSSSGEPAIQATLSNNTARYLMLNPDGGNILIGTTGDSGYKLQVIGQAYIGSGTKAIVGTDGTYSAYGTIGFGGTTNGYNRVFGRGNADDGLYLAAATGRGIDFWTNGEYSRMFITSGGNVLIGTYTDAGYKLHVVGEIYTNYRVQINDGTANLIIGHWDGVNARIENSGGRDLFITSYSSAIKFGISGSENMRIATNGNVGIGTTSPGASLEVDGSFNIKNGDGNITHFNYVDGSTNYVRGTTYFDTSPVYFTGGNVGIGTTVPNEKLTVNGKGYFISYTPAVISGGGNPYYGTNLTLSSDIGSTQGASRIWSRYDGTGAPAISFERSTTDQSYNADPQSLSYTEVMRISGAGNVGIGTTSPSAKLEIAATNATLAISYGNTVPNNPLHTNYYGGYTGIGMDSATAGVRIVGDTNTLVMDAGYYTSNVIQHANWNSLLKVMSNGNVGIGTTSPGAKLTVYSDTTSDGILVDVLSKPRITLRDRGNSDTILGTGDYGLDDFFIDTYSGNAFAIKGSTRNVGIGTISPGYLLDVAGTSRSDIHIFRSNQSAPTADAFIFRPADNTLGLGTANAERMRITSAGNVGIGTTNPTGKLEILGNDNQIILNTAGTYSSIYFRNNGITVGQLFSTNAATYLTTIGSRILYLGGGNGVSQMTLDGTNVGIGTGSPNRTLSVNGIIGVASATANTQQLVFSIDSGASYITSSYFGSASYVPMFLEAGGGVRIAIQTNGNIGIGTTTDAGFKLDVNGTARVVGQLNGEGGVRIDGYTQRYTSFTADGLWGATATPNYISTTGYNGAYGSANFLLGYQDNGSGLYSPAYGFPVKSTDGAGTGDRVVRALIIKDIDKNSYPFTVYNNGNVEANAATFSSSVEALRYQATSSSASLVAYGVSTGLGMYNAGTNILGFATASTNRLTIDASGAATFSSSVTAAYYITSGTGTVFDAGGAGISSIRAAFTNTGGTFYIGRDNSVGSSFGAAYAAILYESGANPMVFWTNATERMRITSGGNVLIGTNTDAGYKLYVNGQARIDGFSGNPALQIRDAGSTFALMGILGSQAGDVNWLLMSGYPNAGDFTIRQSDTVNALTIAKTTGAATFSSSVTATSFGGSSYPYNSILGSGADASTSTVFAGSTSGYASSIDIAGGGATNPNTIIFKTASTERMRIASNGNIGINTNDPLARLDIASAYNSSNKLLYVRNSNFTINTNAYDTVVFQQDDVTTLRIVERNISGTDQLMTLSIGDGYGKIAVSDQPLQFFVNGSPTGVGYQGLGGTMAMHIAINGNVGIGTTTPDYKLTVNGDIYNTNLTFPQTGYSTANSPRIINPMSIKLYDNYFNGIAGSDYGTVLDINGRSGHVDTQIYMDASQTLYFRIAAYASGWGSWKTIIDSSNIASQSVSYATTAGALTSMLISQFTNDSGYITSGALAAYLPLAGGNLTGLVQSTANIEATAFRTDGNFELTSANTGLKSNFYDTRFYASSTSYWNITTAAAATEGALLFRQGYGSTTKGYVYWDSAGFGLLNNTGGWAVRTNIGGSMGGTLYGAWSSSGSFTATALIKSGGTSSQFLKADGSIDTNAYITSAALSGYLPLTGGIISGALSVGGGLSTTLINLSDVTTLQHDAEVEAVGSLNNGNYGIVARTLYQQSSNVSVPYSFDEISNVIDPTYAVAPSPYDTYPVFAINSFKPGRAYRIKVQSSVSTTTPIYEPDPSLLDLNCKIYLIANDAVFPILTSNHHWDSSTLYKFPFQDDGRGYLSMEAMIHCVGVIEEEPPLVDVFSGQGQFSYSTSSTGNAYQSNRIVPMYVTTDANPYTGMVAYIPRNDTENYYFSVELSGSLLHFEIFSVTIEEL